MKRWIAWLAALLILLGTTGCGENNVQDAPELLEPVGVQMDVALVSREDVYTVKAYDGQIVPYVEQLQFPSDGTLAELNVLLGDRVTKGQVLAALDEESLLRQIEALEEELAGIRKLGDFSDRQAEADIGIAETELAKLQAEGASEKVCAQKELELRKLQLKQKQTVQLRQLEIGEKEKKLAALREKTGKNLLTAPFDGRIVYISTVAEGSSVKGYTTVVAIADETRLHLQIDYVSDAVLSDFERIYARVGDKEYETTYLPYDTDAFLSMTLAGEKIKTRFALDAETGELESGQYAAVLALDNYREAVLTVPINALYYDGSGRYVYKIVDGNRVRCDVTVGVITATKAEIIAGLQEGDPVYVKG